MSEPTYKLLVTLIRHGETTSNRDGIIQGQLDIPLSSTGIAQAEILSKRLAKVKIDAIYSSDLSRAHDTAKHIAAHHNCSVIVDKRLREKACGILEGQKWGKGRELSTQLGIPHDLYRPEGGGENSYDLRYRVAQLFNQIYLEHALISDDIHLTEEFSSKDQSLPLKHIVLVTHGGVISEFLKHCVNELNCDTTGINLGIPQNTSISTFYFETITNQLPLTNATPSDAHAIQVLNVSSNVNPHHHQHQHQHQHHHVLHENHHTHRKTKTTLRKYNDTVHLNDVKELKFETL